MKPHQAPIAPSVVEQASEWLMLHWGGELSAQQRSAFDAWQQADPEHQRAWQRLQQLQQTLQGVPEHSTHVLLAKAPDQQRRAALKLLGLLLVAGGSGYLVQDSQPWRAAFAAQRSATGEIRHLTLSDGSRLDLNSASAVDLLFSASERRIRLIQGEILLTSGHDPSRPLIVETPAGDIQALGTRFAVRELDGGTRVDLYEGALRISPRHTQALQLNAGERLWFDAGRVSARQVAQVNASSWSEGRLIAERQPLGQFVAELSRYRPGVLRCDEQVAGLLLTGVFPLADSDAVLAALERSLPVRAHAVTRYWVTLKPRG
ncbi:MULTISPECIES: FecR domain-containing protein [Pseudomonas]|jgi:transmembrane sensor|uniref:Protein FecR n=1 Tax=Pseudomonas protegens (strain DSM 19095 / LMG 27888 / CFBP 6595 / CHA0) TaxID=1124983 RepID=A0A2C9EEB9_PSEPH|nr:MULTISPECIES: FecR family protein [Pseudomonas]AGL81948.1 protein FecR [Pseudomonas protegens CHA0]MBB1613487.1 iron dicitrate transport regulator FecR [Pseudomonas sp. UMC65]MBB1619421.1 iron dicitrate transport regulator FecR [Pseudomonas sp. UME65]MBP5112776.1 FecR family protein [Pseudomonas protegens]MDS9875995.1 FecR family protein [Pseudomonas protegens]